VARVLCALILAVVAATTWAASSARTAASAHRLIVVVKRNLPPAAEKKLVVLILITRNGGPPAAALATPSKPLTVLLANRGLYRVKAEIDSSCKGICGGSYRIAGSANHKLEVVPSCRLKSTGFICSKIRIVKVS
jgi:hypothetical protein